MFLMSVLPTVSVLSRLILLREAGGGQGETERGSRGYRDTACGAGLRGLRGGDGGDEMKKARRVLLQGKSWTPPIEEEMKCMREALLKIQQCCSKQK